MKAPKQYLDLSYYSIIYTETHTNKPICHSENASTYTIFAYHKPELHDKHFEEFTIGELADRYSDNKKLRATIIKS